MKRHGGIIVPMLTPFDEEGEISRQRLDRLVEHLINGGVHGLFPSSSLGEASSMTPAERMGVMGQVIASADGRVPVIPGTGSSDLGTAIELTRIAQDLGADGVVVVTPYYLKPDQKGLIAYFEKLAGCVDLPIYIYQIPMATGVEMTADTVATLAMEVDNIVGMKDSSGNMARIMEIGRKTGDDFLIFQGLDTLLFPSLCVGCAGGMLGTPNLLPGPAVELYHKFQEGELESARRIQIDILGPLFEACMSQGVFPAGFKEAALMLGMDLGKPRLPIRDLTRSEKGRLETSLKEIGLLK
jgi:4-hydroxy-tetrahydrodipicolinate synthase